MASHEKFKFHTLEELRKKIQELGVNIELEEELSWLHKQVKVGGEVDAQCACSAADGRVRLKF